MTFASSFCKKGHCIHILLCIFMGLGHSDPWVESHIRPQQMWGQRSSRGQWPLVQVFAKTVTVSTYFVVCSGETRGSRTTCFKHFECCNFQTITVMYIKAYHFWNGNESENPFWYQILVKMLIFLRKWQKIFFVWSKIFVTS